MTRLSRFLRLSGALAIVWYMALNNKFGRLDQDTRFHVLLAPVYAVILFGVVSLVILINNVIRIQNCDEAYKELKHEIDEARTELTKKGFKFE